MRKKSEQFCHDILDFELKEAKGLISVLLSLGSELGVSSPTALSKSSLFQYHYSIINKITKELSENLFLIENLIENSSEKAANDFRCKIRKHCMNYAPKQSCYKLQSDFTTCRKPYSACLSKRGYVQIPNNKIRGNQPLDIGYYYSYVNLGLYDEQHENG